MGVQENAQRDQNRITGLLVQDYTNSNRMVRIKGDPTTGRLLVNATGTFTNVTRATDAYGYQAKSDDGTYKYYFFEDDNSNWYILRKNKTTAVADYWKGTGGYTTVYVNSTSAPSGSPSWASRGVTF